MQGTGDVQRLPMPSFIIFVKDSLDLFIPALVSFIPSPLSYGLYGSSEKVSFSVAASLHRASSVSRR